MATPIYTTNQKIIASFTAQPNDGYWSLGHMAYVMKECEYFIGFKDVCLCVIAERGLLGEAEQKRSYPLCSNWIRRGDEVGPNGQGHSLSGFVRIVMCCPWRFHSFYQPRAVEHIRVEVADEDIAKRMHVLEKIFENLGHKVITPCVQREMAVERRLDVTTTKKRSREDDAADQILDLVRYFSEIVTCGLCSKSRHRHGLVECDKCKRSACERCIVFCKEKGCKEIKCINCWTDHEHPNQHKRPREDDKKDDNESKKKACVSTESVSDSVERSITCICCFKAVERKKTIKFTVLRGLNEICLTCADELINCHSCKDQLERKKTVECISCAKLFCKKCCKTYDYGQTLCPACEACLITCSRCDEQVERRNSINCKGCGEIFCQRCKEGIYNPYEYEKQCWECHTRRYCTGHHCFFNRPAECPGCAEDLKKRKAEKAKAKDLGL